MKKIDSTKQIIERLKQEGPVSTKLTKSKAQTLYREVKESRELATELAKIDSPKEREIYINQFFRKKMGNINQSELKLLIDSYIHAKIQLGDYITANRWLRLELTKAKLEHIDYYKIERLVLTERKLGNIMEAKELATIALQNNPKGVSLRNELIRIALLEGDRTEAQRLIDEQKKFYREKRKLKTMEFLNYEKDEEDTRLLQEQLDGKEEQNSK